jgi:hypothetical protein
MRELQGRVRVLLAKTGVDGCSSGADSLTLKWVGGRLDLGGVDNSSERTRIAGTAVHQLNSVLIDTSLWTSIETMILGSEIIRRFHTTS